MNVLLQCTRMQGLRRTSKIIAVKCRQYGLPAVVLPTLLLRGSPISTKRVAARYVSHTPAVCFLYTDILFPLYFDSRFIRKKSYSTYGFLV